MGQDMIKERITEQSEQDDADNQSQYEYKKQSFIFHHEPPEFNVMALSMAFL
jgi:hypothetical protein